MKKQKGMTLIEVIISIAIYGIMAMLVTEIMTLVNATMRATDQLNDRLSFEAKFADNLQTTDDEGNTLTRQGVTFQVRYDNDSRVVGADPLNPNPWTAALEYTAPYDNSSVVGTRYSENVNYRFITFDHVSSNHSSFPGENFFVYIRPVPYFTDEAGTLTDTEKQNAIAQANAAISQIKGLNVATQTGTRFLDPTISEIDLLDTYPIVLGGDMAFNIFNSSETVADTDQTVEANLMLNTTKDMFGDNVARAWNKDAPAKIFLYVKVGSSAENITFYNKCLIEWNINNGKFAVSKSYTLEEEIPDPLDYDNP